MIIDNPRPADIPALRKIWQEAFADTEEFLDDFFQVGFAFANNIVPTPQKVEKRNGAFTILSTTKITHDPGLRPSAEYLAEYLPLEIRENNEATEGNIVLRINEKLADEEYRLAISQQSIMIEGSTAGGVHNAIESLLQLLPDAVYSHRLPLPAMVAACLVEDKPHFSYRGFMLDVSRTWVPVDELKQFIANNNATAYARSKRNHNGIVISFARAKNVFAKRRYVSVVTYLYRQIKIFMKFINKRYVSPAQVIRVIHHSFLAIDCARTAYSDSRNFRKCYTTISAKRIKLVSQIFYNNRVITFFLGRD